MMSWLKIDIDKWQEIFKSIQKHKLRTGLTAFGVYWGIFMLVLLLGAISGLQTSFEYDFRDDAVNSLWIYRGRTTMPYKGLKKGRLVNFTNEDYEYLRDEFPEIKDLTGRFYLSSNLLVKYDKESLSFPIRSVHPGHQVLENNVVSQGRYITDRDVENTTKVAVIGEFARKSLFGNEKDVIGKEIGIGGIIYKIVGVFTDSGGENEMRIIYIPITTAQKVYSDGGVIHQLMVSGGDLNVAEMGVLEDKIRNSFASRKQFDPKDIRALRIGNRAEDFQEFASLFFTFSVITWVIGVFSILAGVIGVSNIMLIIVKDRTKEIGIRKALGATPGSIVLMIIQEAMLITSVAGYLGMLSGIGAILLVSDVEADFFRHPKVALSVILAALGILVVAGALAGLIPAYKAAKINPIQAIKSE